MIFTAYKNLSANPTHKYLIIVRISKKLVKYHFCEFSLVLSEVVPHLEDDAIAAAFLAAITGGFEIIR